METDASRLEKGYWAEMAGMGSAREQGNQRRHSMERREAGSGDSKWRSEWDREGDRQQEQKRENSGNWGSDNDDKKENSDCQIGNEKIVQPHRGTTKENTGSNGLYGN